MLWAVGHTPRGRHAEKMEAAASEEPGAEEPKKLNPRQAAQLALEERLRAGETLSKSALKRLRKFDTHEERKEKKKEEKRKRQQARREDGAVDLVPSPIACAPPAAGATGSLDAHAAAAWAFWRRIGSPRRVLAPMVNQSELAFRMLARAHGATLAYTPMLHSVHFAAEATYRRDNFEVHAADRPLVVQFCGHEPATLLAAARHAEAHVDAVELNLGCPQAIARRGRYGAFLLSEPDLVCEIVETLARGLTVPTMVKMRALPSADETVALALRIQAAGCSVLTLHGRTREQKCSCAADWGIIAAVKSALAIPVVANGGVELPEDVDACLAATGADGVMSSEAALENPAIFEGKPTTRAGQVALAREYATLVRAHPPRLAAVAKGHFFKILFGALQRDQARSRELREALGAACSLDMVLDLAERICSDEECDMAIAREGEDEAADTATYATWYRRHRGPAPPNKMGDGGGVDQEQC